MANESQDQHDSVGGWAKRYHYASRNLMESVLREHDLGVTQWYVLYQLAHNGPTMQRDLAQTLQIERATLSGVVATLLRKGFIEQAADTVDARQRLLTLSDAGLALWGKLPDPVELSLSISLGDISPDDLATTVRVLKAATGRLNDYLADPAAGNAARG